MQLKTKSKRAVAQQAAAGAAQGHGGGLPPLTAPWIASATRLPHSTAVSNVPERTPPAGCSPTALGSRGAVAAGRGRAPAAASRLCRAAAAGAAPAGWRAGAPAAPGLEACSRSGGALPLLGAAACSPAAGEQRAEAAAGRGPGNGGASGGGDRAPHGGGGALARRSGRLLNITAAGTDAPGQQRQRGRCGCGHSAASSASGSACACRHVHAAAAAWRLRAAAATTLCARQAPLVARGSWAQATCYTASSGMLHACLLNMHASCHCASCRTGEPTCCPPIWLGPSRLAAAAACSGPAACLQR